MKKATTLTVIPVFLMVVVLAVTIVFYASTPTPSISFPSAGQVMTDEDSALAQLEALPITTLTADEFSAELDTALVGQAFESTKHDESVGVISAINQISDHKTLHQKGSQCNFRCSGSVQIWGSTSGALASVAIVYTAGTRIVFLVLQGPLQVASSEELVPAGMAHLGSGMFLDTTRATWVAAFILSKGMGKAYNPAEGFSLGEGLAAWEFKQAQYRLYIPLATINLP